MPKKPTTRKQLLLELEDLRGQLDEAKNTLHAIRSGEADALIVSGKGGEQLFTLKGADHSYRILIEDMNEGALTLTMEGLIFYANRRFAEILKTPLEKVIGSSIKTWIAPENQLILQSILGQYIDKKHREQSVLTASDGTKVPVFLSVSKLSNSELPYSLCIVATDLTEQKRVDAIEASEKLSRELLAAANQSHIASLSLIEDMKQAEESISDSLKEKEVLLKEVNHRVKNNLTILIGLIKMQENKTTDEGSKDLLKELEGRIRSMAQVHQSLYNSKTLSRVNVQNYIQTMCANINDHFGKNRNIFFSVQSAGVEVGPDIAISLGLILNELITNAYKHAFPENKPRSGAARCEINVFANQDGGKLKLTVANNGTGMPKDFLLEKSESLGLQLVKMLIKQIDGSIELDRSAGTAFIMKFPLADKIH